MREREACNPERVGISVECATCGRTQEAAWTISPACDGERVFATKTVRATAASLSLGTLWYGETCSDFGYAHSHDATRPLTPSDTGKE